MGLLRVTNIQRGCVNDGPGVRTVVFLKGCGFRCPWCCNPETQTYEHQAFIDDEKCLIKNGKDSRLCDECERKNGKRAISECKLGVYQQVARDLSIDDLFEEISKDELQHEITKGGVTFSGGEPLLQAFALEPLLKRLNAGRTHIAFESTLEANNEQIARIKDYIDYWLIDLKLQPEMMLQSESYIQRIRQRTAILKGEKKYRLVYVNSMKYTIDNVINALQKLSITELELLQAHNLAQNKYYKLGLKFVDFTAKIDGFNQFAQELTLNGVLVNKLTI